MEKKTLIISPEPILIPAGDRRVLLNGNPPLVPCRVLAEDRYNRMEKELASMKEVVKELIPIAETLKMYYESQPVHDGSGLQPFKEQATKITSVINRAKTISDNS